MARSRPEVERRRHGFRLHCAACRYVTVALFALATSLFGFIGTAALIAYALAVIHLTMTLLTNMPLGMIKIVPMKFHALVELLVGPVLVIDALAFPSLVAGGREFFVAAGVMIFLVWFLSEYDSAPQS